MVVLVVNGTCNHAFRKALVTDIWRGLGKKTI